VIHRCSKHVLVTTALYAGTFFGTLAAAAPGSLIEANVADRGQCCTTMHCTAPCSEAGSSWLIPGVTCQPFLSLNRQSRLPQGSAAARFPPAKRPDCLNGKSRRSPRSYMKLNSAGKLIQRTTSEASQRLCTSLDWMFTRRRSAIA